MKNFTKYINQWRAIQFLSVLTREVPESSGLYAISRVNRVMGLPIEKEVLYVGKSKNLRRRFKEHVDPWRESSRNLRVLYARNRAESLEFWFLAFPSDLMGDAERELIKQARPKANIIYNGEKS